MAGKNVFNDKDSMDISELASLNDDISPELIEQLQQKLAQDAKNLSGEKKAKDNISANFDESDDTTLFEEPKDENNIKEDAKAEQVIPKKPINIEENFDDNFIKKYKAKLNKQQNSSNIQDGQEETSITSAAFAENEDNLNAEQSNSNNIEAVSRGNITERKLTTEQKNYNDSMDFLDGNVKYSKYVIYIDPQNVDFIESLTVKERKNLINRILREQDDIAITKQRFRIIQTVIKHAIVAILTVAISVPVIYITINASLEATINNYRRSQSIFQTLYKEKGKITQNR